MSRTDRAAKGFVTSILQYLAQIAVQLLLAPVVLKLAGREALGAFAAITQVLGFLSLVDIAHSWSLERFLGQAMGADDGGARFRHVFTTARTLLLISNVLFAILTVIFSLFVQKLFHLSPDIDHQARAALYAIAVWSIVRTPLAAYMNASVATQDLGATNLIGALIGTLRAVASLLFVLAGGGLFGLMVAGIFVEAGGSFLFRARFKKLNPTLMPSWGIPDRPLLREMVGFGGHAMFLNVGNMLVYASGNTLAGLTNGAAVASTYYTSQMPTMTGYNMVLRLSDSATPAINELWGRKQTEQMSQALKRLTRLLLLLSLPLALGVMLFNRDLVVTWVGPQQYAGTLLTVTLALFCIVIALQKIAMIFSFVLGWMRLLTLTGFLQGVANFALGLYLGRKLGLGGITLSLLLVVLPQTCLLWKKIGKFFQFNTLTFLAGSTLRCVLPLLAASALGLGVRSFLIIRQKHLGPFLVEFFVFTITYAAVAYRFSLAPQDKDDIKIYIARTARSFRTRETSEEMSPEQTLNG
jgi:O-antigen/teichoic acid export membrane protein